MPPTPTIHHRPSNPSGGGSRASGSAKTGREEKRSELVCRVKYNNTLPDIPFDPKFLAYPFDSNRFIDYAPTSLERNYKYELLTENDLGVQVDLILPEVYEKPKDMYDEMGKKLDPPLDEKDERLLEDDFSDKTDVKRSQRHAKILSWMRRPDYISTEQTRYQPTTIDKVESKVGFAVRKKMGDGDHPIYMDREAQLAAIEKTFEDAKVPILQHYSKPNLEAKEVYSLLPDDKMWKYPCAQVIFDSDPAPPIDQNNVSLQNQIMSQAMIRGVMDESGEQFVAYFLPTMETMEKRSEDLVAEREYDDEGEYDYKMFREYNWNVKSKASKGYEENFFFVVREDGVYYNELETRVRLSKRRLKAGQQPSNSRLVVRHRPLNKQEHKMQRYRDRCLEPVTGEDEEDDLSDEEEEQEEQIKDTQGDDSASNRSRSKSPSRSRSASRSSRSRSRGSSRSSRKSNRSRSGSNKSSAGSVQSKSRSSSRSSRSRSRTKSRSKSRSRSSSIGTRSSRSRSASSGRGSLN